MKTAKFRGELCAIRATPATVRHFFEMDRAISRALGFYARRRGNSRAIRDAVGVWGSIRDLAGVGVAAKADGRSLRVWTRTDRWESRA